MRVGTNNLTTVTVGAGLAGPQTSATTRLLTDSTGGIAAGLVYDAFGIERGAGNDNHSTPFRFGGEFGYWRDGGERLYVRARHLHTGRGRWDSRDPIGFDGEDWNVYRYVGNDAVSFIDADGTKKTKIPTPALLPCPQGWYAARGSITKCNAPGMGMKTMFCQHIPDCGGNGPCDCTDLSKLVHGNFVAVRYVTSSTCGGSMQIMNRTTGNIQTVAVIDKGPYANGADVDINESIWGYPAAATWPICYSKPISSAPKGWSVCQSG